MSQSQFTGYGGTLDEAVTAAATEAVKSWTPAGPDDMVRVQIDSLGLLYGGIIGHVGTRVATVSLAGRSMPAAGGVAAKKAATMSMLSLKLDVMPDLVYVNLMPPIPHPRPAQPTKIAMLLTVTNSGAVDFKGDSPNTDVAQFTVLHGRTTIWTWPTLVGHVVIPVTIRPHESLSFKAEWDMPDAGLFVNADLHAVGRFTPTGDSAMHRIRVKAVF